MWFLHILAQIYDRSKSISGINPNTWDRKLRELDWKYNWKFAVFMSSLAAVCSCLAAVWQLFDICLEAVWQLFLVPQVWRHREGSLSQLGELTPGSPLRLSPHREHNLLLIQKVWKWCVAWRNTRTIPRRRFYLANAIKLYRTHVKVILFSHPGEGTIFLAPFSKKNHQCPTAARVHLWCWKLP